MPELQNNKIVTADGETLIDLTADTVTASALAAGYTAHNAAGVQIMGTGGGSVTPGKGLEFNSDNELQVVQDVRNQITMAGPYTLLATNWVNQSQKVSCTVDVQKRNVVDVPLSEYVAWGNAGARPTLEESDGITFVCTTVPTSDLSFYLTSMRVKDVEAPLPASCEYRYNAEMYDYVSGTLHWENQGTASDAPDLIWGSNAQNSDGSVATTSTYGELTLENSSDSYTVYMVVNDLTTSGDTSRVVEMRGNGGGYENTCLCVWGYHPDATYNFYDMTNPFGNDTQHVVSDIVPGNMCVIAAVVENGRMKGYYNGTRYGEEYGYNAASMVAGTHYFGKSQYWGQRLNPVHYYDFAIALTAHTEAQIIANSQNLMSKYGIEVE